MFIATRSNVLQDLALVFNSIAAAINLLISFCMVYLLSKERTSFNSSNRVISVLIVFTINSGLVLAALSLSIVITLAVMPSPNLTFGALGFILSSVYCNTVLANLNSRAFSSRGTRSEHSDVPLEMLSQSGQRNQKAFHIHTVTTVHTDYDNNPTLADDVDENQKSRMDQKDVEVI